jgi:hypothetical protein
MRQLSKPSLSPDEECPITRAALSPVYKQSENLGGSCLLHAMHMSDASFWAQFISFQNVCVYIYQVQEIQRRFHLSYSAKIIS